MSPMSYWQICYCGEVNDKVLRLWCFYSILFKSILPSYLSYNKSYRVCLFSQGHCCWCNTGRIKCSYLHWIVFNLNLFRHFLWSEWGCPLGRLRPSVWPSFSPESTLLRSFAAVCKHSSLHRRKASSLVWAKDARFQSQSCQLSSPNPNVLNTYSRENQKCTSLRISSNNM